MTAPLPSIAQFLMELDALKLVEHAGDREAYTEAKAPFIRSVLAGLQ